MKITKVIYAFALAAIVSACGEGTKKETTETTQADTAGVEVSYVINTDSSVLKWKGEMLKVKKHWGTLKLSEGSLTLRGNVITAGSFTADLKTITPLDSAYDKKNTKEKLVAHLTNADFFAVDSFPTATFVVKKMEGNTLIGDLTVRGKTKEQKVTDVSVNVNGDMLAASGKLVFNRQDYGVSYSTGLKDFVLSDDIELNITLKGAKK
ncbi:MAG: YceI family protein [Cytophagaceae bacterium]|nr:YceI family protein [Cytophagaceae bacterium]MDW8456565.1 YceI family protein [Cytophagaceae bacterium]